MRRGQEHGSEALFQLRCVAPRALILAARPLHAVGSRGNVPPALRSLSPVGKHALVGHEGCLGVLRHHARATDDVGVGARCRGALAAMEGRRSAVPTPAEAARAAHEGHLMIS